MKRFERPWPEPPEVTRSALTLISVSSQQPLEIFEFLLRSHGVAQLATQFFQDALGTLRCPTRTWNLDATIGIVPVPCRTA
jgi:hypothetical protein